MNYIDVKYVGILGQQLRNFRRKKDNLYNCSCPICGDSTKRKTKARGYFYAYENKMFYKCHNCHASMSLAYLLKGYFSSLYSSYVSERFKSDFDELPKIVKPKAISLPVTNSIDDVATKISKLPEEHYARKYISNRKLPQFSLDKIYFTDNFLSLVKHLFPNLNKQLMDNDKRIVIPFYDKSNNILAVQGRSLIKDSQLRYITIKQKEDSELIYGLERYNSSDAGYVVEGPIDSLFLNNCLATANSNLEIACDRISSALTLIYDNEPKNKQILNLMEKAISNRRKICIWPKNIKEKDINDMILSGKSENEIQEIIKKRTFVGLNALLEFNSWKKM